jgi:hypothetical protein
MPFIAYFIFSQHGIRLFDSPPDTKGLPRCIPPVVGMRVQTSRSALFYGLFFGVSTAMIIKDYYDVANNLQDMSRNKRF